MPISIWRVGESFVIDPAERINKARKDGIANAPSVNVGVHLPFPERPGPDRPRAVVHHF